MFQRRIRELSQFKHLIEIMEQTPRHDVPSDFTDNVMAGVSADRPMSPAFSAKNLSAVGFALGFRRLVTRMECSFYFFMTGFFYFILGLILMAGFWIAGDFHPGGWLAVQPFFSILLAMILSLTGMAVGKNGESAMPFVRAGILLYTVFIILNGWMGVLTLKIPSAVFVTVIFSAAGLGMAFLLGLAINRYRPGTIFSEVRG